jgi:hypothetical protein
LARLPQQQRSSGNQRARELPGQEAAACAGSGRALVPPAIEAGSGAPKGSGHVPDSGAIAIVGIDIGKTRVDVVGPDRRGAIALWQKWSRGEVEARRANLAPPCLIGMEAFFGAHHLNRKLQLLGHNARLMPAKCARPYSKGRNNDLHEAEAIAEACDGESMTAQSPARQQRKLASSARPNSALNVQTGCRGRCKADLGDAQLRQRDCLINWPTLTKGGGCRS